MGFSNFTENIIKRIDFNKSMNHEECEQLNFIIQ